ncbi:MAG: 50S ribosomal protein L35 [Patescibacteria group bacterium]|nr:50S ribosomal protein L35 [Patescibacteria group bacterium]
MPKLKTRKSVVKRFKVTSKKKILRRRSRQNHFNARQDSNHKRTKRNDKQVVGKQARNILTDIDRR